MWVERAKYINTDYDETGWMLCVINHIREGVFKTSNRNHRNQVNIAINTLFDDSSEKELHETLDAFWSEYTNFNHNIDHFDSNKFIWSSKDIHDGNSHIWHQK